MFKNKKLIIILSIFILLLTVNFMTNFLSNDYIIGDNFENFQNDSEELVLSKIFINKNCKYGLCNNDSSYESNVGLQGYIFSFLKNQLHIPVLGLKIITALLLAIVLVLISYFLSIKYDRLFGIIFYGVSFLSPWLIGFANNLYWVPFTWFTPSLFALILSLNYDKKKLYIPLIFIAIFIKCLCGYEYITSIMLLTIVFMITDFFVAKTKEERINIFKTIFLVGVTALLAFSSALIIHGFMRGNGNLITGIKDIYHEDVLRRTILTFDKDSYDGVLLDSMNVSAKKVVKDYIYIWSTDLIYGLNNMLFPIIIFLSFLLCIINIYKKKNNSLRDLLLFILLFFTTISWFILGKSHSYIHTHMNYVLWYFGFMQICIYIIIKNFIYLLKNKNIDKYID